MAAHTGNATGDPADVVDDAQAAVAPHDATTSASVPPDRGSHRIGDAERQQAIDVLRTHTGAGRLTLDEFSDLAGEVYQAQTYAELEAVGRKLPPGLLPDPPPAGTQPPVIPPMTASPAPSPNAPAGSHAREPGARQRRQRFFGIFGSGGARGPWRPASRIRSFALCGGVVLDFRYAEVEGPVDVTAWAVMGGVTVVVAEGTRVDLDGCVVMGGSTNATRNLEADPDSPIIRVHARGLWGGVTVVSRKTRAQKEAAAVAAGVDPDTIDLREHGRRTPDLLELPRHVLDDIAATIPVILAGPGRHAGHHRHRHGPGPGWPPAPPRPPSPPEPPWANRNRDRADRRRSRDGRSGRNGSTADATKGPSGTLTMMVTDIVDSTRLAERLGDRRWITVLARHYEIVRTTVAEHGGTEVKAQGDGFIVVFPSARRAILAAIAVQRAVAACDEHPDAPLRLRVGLHTGEIVDVDGDVLGQNVVVAVRIADRAEPGEVVVSGMTRDLTAAGGDLEFGPAEEVELKGLSQPWRVHRVAWQPDPA